tara:strand:- start:3631 stop:4386 length:756 start_codon:yes stop_codon:yes gene_type:complete
MVNIDTVYQRVLALANKEQRGYITPLEFNLLANQASLTVFEQYFYDRGKLAMQPGNSTEYSDTDSMLDEKIFQFNFTGVPLPNNNTLPMECYRLGGVFHNLGNGIIYEAEAVSEKDRISRNEAPLLQPTDTRPIYTRRRRPNTPQNQVRPGEVDVYGDNNRLISGGSGTGIRFVLIDYIARPHKVEWGYDVVGEKALHNGSVGRTFHFDHHASEETTLVMKVLELAGVIIEDAQVVQYANQASNQTVQQQK